MHRDTRPDDHAKAVNKATSLIVASACALFGACAERGAAVATDSRCGNESCRRHQGNLAGCAARGHVDVSHLTALVEVTGSLSFRQCLDLERLDGLEHLEEVGSLSLLQVPRLRRIDQTRKLTTVRGSLIISNLPSLENIEGFNSVTSVRENLVLEALPKLRRIDGLGGLRQVGHLQIMRNDALEDLTGLIALKVVRGELRISDNPKLSAAAIQWLIDRIEVKGAVRVEHNGR